jgi:hypothetical protein
MSVEFAGLWRFLVSGGSHFGGIGLARHAARAEALALDIVLGRAAFIAI